MTGGFYLMHRGWMDNPIFSDEPFTEREAWHWLIQEACFEPHKMRWRHRMISVSRGQVPTTYRDLKKIFKWGNDRVRRFLDLLESEQMIRRETGTGFLIVSICNYDKYQRPDFGTGTQSGTQSGTESGTHSGTNINKVKESKRTSDDDGAAAQAQFDKQKVNEAYEWVERTFNSPTALYLKAPVIAWFTWGADFELDIKPVVERYIACKKSAPRSLSWLDEHIAASIKQRTRSMPAGESHPYQPRQSAQEVLDAQLARLQQKVAHEAKTH